MKILRKTMTKKNNYQMTYLKADSSQFLNGEI